MRKLAAVMVAATLLTLAGCASGSGGYIETIRADAPELADTFTEDELVTLGEAVCEALDGGLSGHRVAGTLETSGLTLAEAGQVVIAASDHLCPEHASEVN